MSPRELAREFDAAVARKREESNRDLAQAWYVAGLMRIEKFPTLTEWLAVKTPHRQTPDEQREVLRLLSKRTGIPLREVVH